MHLVVLQHHHNRILLLVMRQLITHCHTKVDQVQVLCANRLHALLHCVGHVANACSTSANGGEGGAKNVLGMPCCKVQVSVSLCSAADAWIGKQNVTTALQHAVTRNRQLTCETLCLAPWSWCNEEHGAMAGGEVCGQQPKGRPENNELARWRGSAIFKCQHVIAGREPKTA